MKRKVMCALLGAALLCLCGCSADPLDGVSQLRTDILAGTCGTAEFTAYAEEREIPLSADGTAGERMPVVIVKIVDSAAFYGTYSIFLSYGGREYSAAMTPTGEGVLRATVNVDALPQGALTATLKGERELAAELVSCTGEHAGWETALSLVKTELKTENAGGGEYFVRILCEKGNVFWYVGYTDGKENRSFLTDAEGKEILASRRAG